MIFVTVVYSAIVLVVAGLAMTLQGDCWAGTTQIEASECSHNATVAGLVVIGAGVALYFAARHFVRSRW